MEEQTASIQTSSLSIAHLKSLKKFYETRRNSGYMLEKVLYNVKVLNQSAFSTYIEAVASEGSGEITS